MFGPKRAEVVTVPNGPDDEPQPQPRRKPPMHEADCFKPSTFASRKAKAELHRAALSTQRLVSLGETEFAQRDLRRGGDVTYHDAELFVDLDHPVKRYIRVEGGRLMALQDEGTPPDPPVKLPPVKGSLKLGSAPDPRRPSESLPEPPPRPV